MHVSQRLLVGVIVVVSLAGCGPTVSAPTRTTATVAPLGSAATPLARATVLSQTVAPTRGGAAAFTPDASPASAVAATTAPPSTTPPSVKAVALPDGRGGVGFDDLRYDATLAHLYLPGATSATMAIVGVSASGTLSLLGTVATTADAHCVAADTHGAAWVCDPDHGQLLQITDPFPAAGT